MSLRAINRKTLAGDLWGGLASMLVALPASIAFGVAVWSPLGADQAAHGALAGLLGATALGILAPIFGGTDRLITAPCAPAAAVMGALALDLAGTRNAHAADAPARALLVMTVVPLLSSGLQILYGLLRGGTLIKYVPYPVVAGYLSGVGVVIFLKQLPSLFGLPKAVSLLAGLTSPSLWQWHALVVGTVTIVLMAVAARITKVVPAPIIGLCGGALAYAALGLASPSLFTLDGNPLVIGRLASTGGSLLSSFGERFAAIGLLRSSDVAPMLMSALTLSALLSIDTLKTCVVVDTLTRTRHDSNREIIGQGLANLGSALIGGMPGAGTSGPTLVNVASGGKTRLSSVLEGVLALLAFVLLGPLLAWAPLAALAGILIVVAFRMFDWGSFRLLKQKSTVLDFVVIATVIAVAVGIGLITSSAVGIALAIVLFVREEIRGSVIHRKLDGTQIRSRQRRIPEEMAVLDAEGGETLVCELEGNLFFGTTDQLLTQLSEDLRTRRFLILDLRRVRSVDFTAVHMLERMEAQLRERGAHLVFSNLPKTLPAGQDLRAYFDEVGLMTRGGNVQIFGPLSDALEWAEERVLDAHGRKSVAEEPALGLDDFEFVRGRKEETRDALAVVLVTRSVAKGDAVFRQGEASDDLYFIRRGKVRIETTGEDGAALHLATFARGDFFGDMAFLDNGVRSASAIAEVPTDLYGLSRAKLDAVANQHPRLGQQLFAAIAHTLALRLRQADNEIRALENA
jgi:sulfate permease, SulP family